MDYQLSSTSHLTFKQSARDLLSYLGKDKIKMVWALAIVILNSIINIATPYLIGLATDTYIVQKDLVGLATLIMSLILLYLIGLGTSYLQMKLMGVVSQNMLYNLRTSLFNKLQSLPLSFFQQNKIGDLTARINSDTDKLNQFFSESIMRFLGNFFFILGIGIFVLIFQWQLGLVMLLSTLFIIGLSTLFKNWVQEHNKGSAAATGALSGQIQESLSNFKVIVAFNKRQYFIDKLNEFNQNVFTTSNTAGFANSIYKPIYDSAGIIAQALVLVYGLILINNQTITIGVLIAFLNYAQKFYDPLRILGTIIGNIQVALASWQRVNAILILESNLKVLPEIKSQSSNNTILQVERVSFGYTEEQKVLENVSFALVRGKTYALVGPTGGGKSTLASLMTRLYDPTEGVIYLKGRDIRSFTPDEIAEIIGVILQEPLLFSGTLGDNIRYGNKKLRHVTNQALQDLLAAEGLQLFINRFSEGLDATIQTENISLGQRQLISFIRIILRKPELLILDEATANVDTVTEQLLNQLIEKLPSSTTKVIIAHRLNTIKAADTIMFINGGHVKEAMDFEHAIHLIDHAKRKS
ncbi:MAG: ABC transporter ATP-binding protein [Candidatus Abawacabacteria bacterium]|nr:ABC transporter ATP-binding protein [Candidatus Abawacabacteria bacterium]